MELWELVAREQVRDTVATYAHAGDSGRVSDVADCFARDGVLVVRAGGEPTTVTGREAVRDLLQSAVDRPRDAAAGFHLRHRVVDLLFRSVSPARIELRSYFAVVTPDGLDHWGRYDDVLVPQGARWVFASRRATVEGRRPGSWLDT